MSMRTTRYNDQAIAGEYIQVNSNYSFCQRTIHLHFLGYCGPTVRCCARTVAMSKCRKRSLENDKSDAELRTKIEGSYVEGDRNAN